MSIRKIIFVLCLFALALAGVLLWTLPADVGYRQARQYLGPVTLSGVGGTVWDGHADGVSVLGYDLGEMDWHASKAALLHGELAVDIRVKGANIDIAGSLVRGPGRIAARDLRFSVPAVLLEPIIDVGDAKMHGTLSGTLARGVWSGGMFSEVSGDARWNNEKTAGPAEMPNLLADFASRPDGDIAGTLHDDAQGNLAVEGTFTLRPGSVDARLRFSARNGDAVTAAALRYLGQMQPDGTALLNVHERTLKVF